MTAEVPLAPVEPRDWEAFRRQMPIAQTWAYFDHAAVSPLPEPTRQALADWAQQAAHSGDTVWPAWSRKVEELRRQAAHLIGALPEEIALVGKIHGRGAPGRRGVSLAARRRHRHPGRRVPHDQYPSMNLAERGVQTRRVPTENGAVDLDRLADACDRRTRIVSVSWVSYSSGWRNDLERIAAIAHRCGAVFPGRHSGPGRLRAGCPAARRSISWRPTVTSGSWGSKGRGSSTSAASTCGGCGRWAWVGTAWSTPTTSSTSSLRPKDTADRDEGGSRCVAGLVALAASLELLMSYGAEALGSADLQVTDRACRGLREIGAVLHSDRSQAHASGIAAFELPGRDPLALKKHCLQAQRRLQLPGRPLADQPPRLQ